MVFVILSFQSRRLKGILFFQILGNAAFIVQYIFLRAYIGSVINFLGLLRNFFFMNMAKSWASKKIWLYTYILIFIVAGIISWVNIYSILPMMGLIISTFAYRLKNERKVRILLIPSMILGLLYNIAVLSFAGIISQVFILASLWISISRYNKKIDRYKIHYKCKN